jgi:phosphohistidine phosphatase
VKHLYLLRHAKSSWKQRGLSDHDRPLSRRGRRATTAITRHMREQGIEPELVLCSTARRAHETLERIDPVVAGRAVQVESELYGASASALLERLRLVPDAVGSVMLIGHNPGLQRLALELSQSAPEARELEAKYPTAALAILAFDRPSWGELDRGTAELVSFVRPRDLEE